MTFRFDVISPAVDRARAGGNVMSRTASGPLVGLRVVEFESIGPGPFAAMMLSDMGAEVVTIARPASRTGDPREFVMRGRRVVPLDLKRPEDLATALDLVVGAEVLIEGLRPGVMERLGLGPDVALARNPALVYGRMTGWGQFGPLAETAGHDINYISITGALGSFRAADGAPVSPLNLVGDYGGGALYLVVGLLAAVLEARGSGRGQVVDAAMCDGVSHMLTMFRGLMARDRWIDAPRANSLDGGAHYYGTYRCADGEYLAVGAIEPQFYAVLRRIAGLDDPDFDAQLDAAAWPRLREKAAAIFLERRRDEWVELFGTTDACVTPVLGLTEAFDHPHLVARSVHVEAEGHLQPAPAPRFGRTPSRIQTGRIETPDGARDILRRWRKP
jgi:alpha-methylacyl-CoA racemase